MLAFRDISSLETSQSCFAKEIQWRKMWLRGGAPGDGGGGFDCVSMMVKREEREFSPRTAQLLKHPLAIAALVPKNAALFTAGAIAGAAAKIVTAPFDRIKLLMQTHGIRAGQESAKKAFGFIEENIQISCIGDSSKLPDPLRKLIIDAKERMKQIHDYN